MSTGTVGRTLSGTVRAWPAVATGAAARVAYLDNIRYLMVLLVVLYHAVGAYAPVAPHWAIHDTPWAGADLVRELLDVFVMAVLFFVAGYFTRSSLARHGVQPFVMDKIRRLIVPWVLGVLVVFPLALYDLPGHVRPFRAFWLAYLGAFGVLRLRPIQMPEGLATQGPYWFISLLFTFFLLCALGYALARRLSPGIDRQAADTGTPAAGSDITLSRGAASTGVGAIGTIGARLPLGTLTLFGLLMAGGYFAGLLVVPDTSWFTLGPVLEFQVTRLVFYAGYFGLGVYAQARGWLAGSDGIVEAPGGLALWTAGCGVLGAAYLLLGQPLFAEAVANLGRTTAVPAGLLAAFAVVRSAFLLALLVVLVCAGSRYWNRTRPLDRQLAATSYNIYLVHYWFIVLAQGGLRDWTGGPAFVKAALVFVIAGGLSYALSRWVLGRHARPFVAVLLALFVFCLVARP